MADLSALPAAAREREMLRLATAEAGRPFDLARGPLFRAALFRLGEEEHVLAVTLHHVVSDGWSAGVLIREMAALYGAFSAGLPSPLPELPIQYADYAVWQRRRLGGETLEKELAFWRARLAGTPPLELPTDRPRPAQATSQGGQRRVEVAPAALPRAHALAREVEGSLYMVLLAVFETLLLRYSGQADFAVGTPVANRNRGETEGLIGFFVNTLVLRSSLAEGLTFRGLLRRVTESTLAAFAHEEMPFDKLVEELQPDREGGRNPLFQVVLTLQNQPRPALAMGDLSLAVVDVETATAKFDLTFSWSEEEGRLRGGVEYSAALFDGATAERMGRHFATLLAGAAAAPDLDLWALPLLDAAERRQTLADWNRTARPYPGESPVHELFEAWAERAPGAVAVEFGDARLTYGELNERANRLAHRLRRLGVGPEELVVLSIPRSLEMIEGMMGILKAGGAYLPLDPTQPRDRLAFLVEESRPAAVVTLEEHLGALPEFGQRAVCLDRDRESLAGEPADDPRGGATPENLVYVLYTSGSTGRPKAVAVPHRGLVRLVAGADYARLDSDETFFQFAPLSFDPSTLEIFGALANGGRLAVAPAGPFSLAELGRVIRGHGVTTLWLTSGLFHQMIEEGLDDLRGVRQLLSGGDVLSPSHVRRALEALPGVDLIDGYGPTENSCFTTCYRVDPDDPPGAYVPIGKPMANTKVYILDRESRPVPVGVPGELLTGGDGLARGYRGRPELTAERFVPSPFAGELDPPGARLYRTGDLARWRPDGNVEFLGRMDNQVKIRGYRIEPGEVEAVLAGHPALAECAVVVRREASGEKRLVAFYVPSSPVAPADLKEHLGASLPAYMIPSAFVEMAELPLTVSGKVDRRALSRLEAPSGEGPSEVYAEPQTRVERRIAAIWSDLLGRERIGLHDSFFDLGGHSLLATRVLSRLRETLQADLPLAVVFERPTLAGLAGAVEEALGSRPEAGSGGAGAAEEPGVELAWWREHLSGAPTILELPTDRPRPAVAALGPGWPGAAGGPRRARGAAGGALGGALPLRGPARAAGGRGVPQPPAVAGEPRRRPLVPGAAGPGARGDPRGGGAPGSAVRAPGPRAGAGARRGSPPTVPGDADGGRARGDGGGEAGPPPRDGARGRGARRVDSLPPRPLRGGDGPAPGGAPPGAAGGGGRRPRTTGLSAAAAERRGARGARGLAPVSRHLDGGGHSPRPLRGAGAAAARGGRAGGRRAADELRRAGAPVRGAGPLAAAVGGGTGGARGPERRALAGAGGGHPRHPAVRWRAGTPGSGPPGGAAGPAAGGFRADGDGRPGEAGGEAVRRRLAGAPAGVGERRRRGRSRGGDPGNGAGLRDLHLRVDGAAQGGGGLPRQHRADAALEPRDLRPEARGGGCCRASPTPSTSASGRS